MPKSPDKARKAAPPRPRATAASKKAVTPDNLATLGAAHLAAILAELAEDSADIKRRLRLELAAQQGGDAIAAEIARRLATLHAARAAVPWEKHRDVVRDLDLQRAMIAGRVAPSHPHLALDLMWRFLDLATPVFDRVDDSTGLLGGVFQAACNDLGAIAAQAGADPDALAGQAFATLMADEYGACHGLVPRLLPALGDAGAAHLKRRLSEVLADPKAARPGGRADDARRALQDIADGQGDADAYIALVPTAQRAMPHAGAAIARRLLAAGRADEALAALEAAAPKPGGLMVMDRETLQVSGLGTDAWEQTFVDALDAAGRKQEAQDRRWADFEQRLSPTLLRDYLKRLPDFDDVEAEHRAMQHALGVRSFYAALHFFLHWPDQSHAAKLVLARATEIDGNQYALLDPAAQWLEGKHPLAATLLRRAMIDDTLDGAKSSRYKHAARHLIECAALAPSIQDYAGFETHDAFAARLRAKHARKAAFWNALPRR